MGDINVHEERLINNSSGDNGMKCNPEILFNPTRRRAEIERLQAEIAISGHFAEMPQHHLKVLEALTKASLSATQCPRCADTGLNPARCDDPHWREWCDCADARRPGFEDEWPSSEEWSDIRESSLEEAAIAVVDTVKFYINEKRKTQQNAILLQGYLHQEAIEAGDDEAIQANIPF